MAPFSEEVYLYYKHCSIYPESVARRVGDRGYYFFLLVDRVNWRNQITDIPKYY